MIHANGFLPAVQWFFLEKISSTQNLDMWNLFSFILLLLFVYNERRKKKLMNEVKEKNVGYYHLVFLHCLTHTHKQNRYMRVYVLLLFCTILFKKVHRREREKNENDKLHFDN